MIEPDDDDGDDWYPSSQHLSSSSSSLIHRFLTDIRRKRQMFFSLKGKEIMEHRLVGGSEEAEAFKERGKEGGMRWRRWVSLESVSLSFESRDEKYVLRYFPTFFHLLNRLSSSPLYLSRSHLHYLLAVVKNVTFISLNTRKRVFSPHLHHLSNSFPFPPPLLPLLFSSFYSDTVSGTLSSLWNSFRQFSRFFDQRHYERNCYVCTLLPASLFSLSNKLSWTGMMTTKEESRASLFSPSLVFSSSPSSFLSLFSFWPVDPDTQRRGKEQRGDKWRMR